MDNRAFIRVFNADEYVNFIVIREFKFLASLVSYRRYRIYGSFMVHMGSCQKKKTRSGKAQAFHRWPTRYPTQCMCWWEPDRCA